MRFQLYGVLGLLIIVFSELVLFLRIFPLVFWFTPIIWFGYILLIDAIVFSLKGSSLLSNKPGRFLQLFLVSVNFWYVFEMFNKFSQSRGWYYVNLPPTLLETFIMGSLSFGTILPAVIETWDLVRSLHLFKKFKPKIKIPINKFIVSVIFSTGVIFLILPFVWTTPWIWAFVWMGFIFLIDPVLYIFGDEKSLLMQLKKRNFNLLVSVFLSGYIAGFFWEFWNHWAYTKWYYSVPILDNIRVFEIPAVGFIAYGPFALELYVMYRLTRLLFHHMEKQHLIRI